MFLEESLPIDARTGAVYGDRYNVESAKDPRTGKTYSLYAIIFLDSTLFHQFHH